METICRSVLRVHSAYVKEEYLNALLSVKDLSAAFDGALVFVGDEGVMTHDVFSPARIAAFAKKAKPLLEGLKARGLKTGWNLLSTIGHHAEAPDRAMDGMDFMRWADNTLNRGALCPVSGKTLAYVAEVYGILSEYAPDMIFSDDDLSYGAHCWCAHCLAGFKAFSGLDFIDAKGLSAMLVSPKTEVRERARKAWLDYYRVRIDRIFSTIVSVCAKNAPDAAMGFMTCVLGSDGMGAKKWSETLGKNGTAYIRAGGGVYTDNAVNNALKKAHSLGRQTALARGKAVSLAEVENFPYQAIRKSAKFTVFEAMCYVAAGCNGAAYNLLPYSGTKEEYEPFIRMIAAARPFLEEIDDTFANGVYGVGWGLERAFAEDVSSLQWHSELDFDDELFSVGFPPAYTAENACVTLLNGRYAAARSDEELGELLRGAVFMDADALDVLNARGFAADTGFRTVKDVTHNAVERDLPHPWNEKGGFLRDARLEFSLNRHPEFESAGRVAVIEATNQKAELVTEMQTYTGETLGGASGRFENPRGGRVFVGGYAPFTWCYSLPRKTQLINAFQWLSKGALTGYVSSYHKAAFFARKTKEGKNGGVLCNCSLDDAENVRVALHTKGKTLSFSCFDGKTVLRRTLETKEEGGGYRTAVLPRISSLSAGIIIEE
ncbi:MAG: hypothetical protein DBX59_04770 [Bacillota bacterium]|nr:MAG: hypothetical protein DBX59_04770 [Bacillota bacterium]